MANRFTFTQPSREPSHRAIETVCGTEKSNTSLVVPVELTPIQTNSAGLKGQTTMVLMDTGPKSS